MFQKAFLTIRYSQKDYLLKTNDLKIETEIDLEIIFYINNTVFIPKGNSGQLKQQNNTITYLYPSKTHAIMFQSIAFIHKQQHSKVSWLKQ